MQCGQCQLESLELQEGSDGYVGVTHTDENDVPTDCTGWTVSADVTYLGRVVAAVPIVFTDITKGQATMDFTRALVASIQPKEGAILSIMWTDATGRRDIVKVNVEVVC